ncbi:zinc finger protein 185 [Catharus ustulatus]|uniref:zinc finger protein 185 n=1 Tax=Catharus ustulatus TaxID=91951 RepID=UPI00140CF8C4|nr:zinc finger protein 185 [Catharus ustulatus]
MMSLGVAKGGLLPTTDEDRRRIIRQMKVRTTLRGDQSWIQHHNSDSDEDKSSPLPGGRPPAPKPAAPQQDRSSASKPQPGYLIRGVFTRTIDKSSSDSSSPSSQAQKKASQSRSPSGYRMTTEDYKKLAPYNIRQKSGDGDQEDSPFSPDEHKKRAEAANSVLRRSAGRERAYVLSAAKKSNGSPAQEFPALFAKRIEIEEEEGQQRRSPGPGSPRCAADSSSANGLRKTSPGPSWDEAKAAAASPCSPKPGSRSQTSPSLSDTLGKISISAETRNAEDRQELNGKSSLGEVSQRGDGDKALKEKPERFPWEEGAPRATNGSFPEHTEAKNGFYPPESPLQSDVPFHSSERTSVHMEDTEYSFKRSALGYEDRSSSTGPEGSSHHQPYWEETRFLDPGNLTERDPGAPGHESPPETPRLRDPSEPSRAGCVSENTLESESDLSVPVPRSELHSQDTAGSRDRDVGMSSCVQSGDSTATRSRSVAEGSSIPAPETAHAEECEPRRDRIAVAHEEQSTPSTDRHWESLGGWKHSKPSLGPASRSDLSSQESVPSALESRPPGPLFQERQSFGGSVPSHRIPAYVDSQVFSTRRPSPDAQGSVYSGSSWYDSARGHGDFSLTAGRDATMAQRSHRVPFYMDSLNCNSTRLLSSSSERLCSSHHSSGYQPDSSTAGRGILFVKEYVNTGGFTASPRHGSLVDLSDLERSSYSQHSFLSSAPLLRSSEPLCSYCSREIRDCPKIIIEHLNIHCHEYCFRCGICHKAMGDLLDKIFIHRDIVHCDKCYEKLF